MTPHGSPSRKLHIDPAKDYSAPLNVETSVEYDLPEHIYPPKGAAPILMVHPGFVSTPVRVRSRAVITPSPTAMVATSGATRPLAPLQQQQGLTNSNSSSRPASRTSRSWCSCGNPNCNFNSVKSVSVQSVRNMQNVRNVQSIENIPNAQSVRSVSSRDVIVISDNNRSRNSAVLLQKQQQQQHERNSTVIVVPHSHQDSRNSAVLLRQPSSGTGTTTSSTPSTQQLLWGGRCSGPCCQPRPAAIAPQQAEFIQPGLPPSHLLARTPTRGTAGGSPKLRAARSRRGMSVASTVNLPDYMTMSTSRSARAMGNPTTHSRPRALSTSMGALVATPAPPMAHQQHMQASLTTSLDLARAHSLTPKSLFHAQQPPQFQQSSTVGLTASMGPSLGSSMVSAMSSASMGGSTSSLLSTVGLSRDSGCSTGGDHPLDWTSDRTRGLVDSGFCTPVDLTDDFIAETLSLPSWKESPTSSSSMGHTSSPLLPGTSHHHYLPQPLWNLVY